MHDAQSGNQDEKQRQRHLRGATDCGAGERTRTADLLITNQLLYQLSYAGWVECARPIRPLYSDFTGRQAACGSQKSKRVLTPNVRGGLVR